MVSSFPQAGPCICEVAPWWLGSCHLYYGSTSICAAQQPWPSSVALKGALPRLNTLQLKTLRICFSYNTKILKAFYCFLPIEFLWKDGNFNVYKLIGSPMLILVCLHTTEKNLMSLKCEPVFNHPVKYQSWSIVRRLLISNLDSASNTIYILKLKVVL